MNEERKAMGRRLQEGIRFFECACGHDWTEPTRDIDTPSGVNCPECDDWVTPTAGVATKQGAKQ